MDDRRLQIFLAAVRTGSFSRAAVELNCTQSAVTQAMNGLESELGCKLLLRNHSGVQLTPEGEQLLPTVIEADVALSRLRTQAASLHGAVSIRLGSFSSIANTWLPKVIQAYQEDHPQTIFDIRIGTDSLPSWLQSGEIDLALGDAERCGNFQWYPLMDDPYYAVAPYALIPEDISSITQEQLIEYPFIMAPMNSLKSHLCRLPEKSISVNCDDDATLLSMIAQGLGLTAMPRLSLQNLPTGVRAIELLPSTKRVIGVAVVGAPPKGIRKFISFLQRYFNSPQ